MDFATGNMQKVNYKVVISAIKKPSGGRRCVSATISQVPDTRGPRTHLALRQHRYVFSSRNVCLLQLSSREGATAPTLSDWPSYISLPQYCNKDCQNAHWKVHKKDCKSQFSKKTWQPQWIAEKRVPSFVTDDDGPMMSYHGLNKHLWGNTPAFDHVQLLKNEGVKWDQSLALCFAASGDLRNVITSVNCLPKSHQLPCGVVINDHEVYIVLRNLLILFTFASFPPDGAAEMALHLWYSPKLPSKMMARLRPIFNEKLDKIFTHMAKNPLSPSNTLLKAKFQLTDKASIVTLLPKWFWVEMKKMLELKITSQQADYQRHLITLNPDRHDYRDRHLSLLGPYYRVSKMKYYEDGLIMPFGGVDRSSFFEPNFTLFDTSGRWTQNDSQDPLSCWSYDELQSNIEKYSLPSNDLYGALYFHLLGQFRLFAYALGTRELCFTLLGEDARHIPTTLPKLLKDITKNSINPHATLITLFLNYSMETPIPEAAEIRAFEGNMKIIRPLLLKDGEAVPPKHPCNSGCMKLMTWMGYFDDREKQWREKTGMKQRMRRTVIEKTPYRVKKDMRIDNVLKDVKHLDVTGLAGNECYIEWVRAR
ncbi:hypothetical protein NLJ89_g8195 [Agrocybe chaxingu]|uniref:Suppressor of anucleate metulae protein B n=1 Tax=Agrocybe chaxingu TaxID=84603 RepID=A0A9W8MSZ3_9AGAR|nr:hypothetical protein NLJ89_g8195 [Agrocybe chaxingu]